MRFGEDQFVGELDQDTVAQEQNVTSFCARALSADVLRIVIMIADQKWH
jgi:hypothetical protein